MAEKSFDSIFKSLRKLLSKYEPSLKVIKDTPENYYLNTPYVEKYDKELFFGAVQIKKNYVSYYFMPVYMFPDLVDNLSPVLKKRMHGKSCFNFKKHNDEQFRELGELTQKGFERLENEGLL